MAAMVLCACAIVNVRAEQATAPALRAEFLFRFAAFTEWPAEALLPGAPLVICVLGDSRAAAGLEEYASRRTIQGHRIVVWKGLGEGPVHACHVLYVEKAFEKYVTQVLDGVRDAPVLTVGDSPRFAQTLGTVQFLTDSDRTMKFAINVEAARRKNLRLSSQLLSLAKIVRTPADAPLY